MQIQTLNLKEIRIDENGPMENPMYTDSIYKEYCQQKLLEKTKKKSFWKRQFQVEATRKQIVFDGIFGIVLPVVCFLFDPVVFKANFDDQPLAGEYKPFAYILSFVSIMGLLAFMLWGKKLKWLNGLLCGLFVTGAVISLGIGIALFPFSLLGLMILIGILGFTPLFTSLVYWRNAVRAYKTSLPVLESGLPLRMMILSAMFSAVIPGIINAKIHNGLETMNHGNAAEIRRTAQRLKYVAPLVDFSKLKPRRDDMGAFVKSEENEALAESYKMLTGKELFTYRSIF